MASEKLFTIAGTSILNGVTTFRFATGEVKKRVWVLNHNGHTEVDLRELPKPMTKDAAVAFLTKQGLKAVLPNASSKGKTPEQIAAEAEAKREAEEAAKREDKNRKRREARAAARAAEVAKADASFVNAPIIPEGDETE